MNYKHRKMLPKTVKKTVWWYVKNYPEWKKQISGKLGVKAVAYTGMPSGTGKSDPTADTAERVDDLMTNVRIVETAAGKLPEEYRAAVLNYAIFRKPFPAIADRKTWFSYLNDFLYYVAEGCHLI